MNHVIYVDISCVNVGVGQTVIFVIIDKDGTVTNKDANVKN